MKPPQQMFKKLYPNFDPQSNQITVWDFDKTLTIEHTSDLPAEPSQPLNNQESQDARYLSVEKRKTNLRNPNEIKNFLTEWHKAGNIALIVTGHIEKYR